MHVDPHTGRHAEKERGQREREKKSEKEEGKKKVLGRFLLIIFSGFCPNKSSSNSRLRNSSLNIYVVQINVSHCLLPLVHTECKGEIELQEVSVKLQFKHPPLLTYPQVLWDEKNDIVWK